MCVWGGQKNIDDSIFISYERSPELPQKEEFQNVS